MNEQGRAILRRIAALPNERWRSCPTCRRLLDTERIDGDGGVCPACGHYFRLGARARITLVVDPGTFCEIDAELSSGDPLEFVDRVSYPDRLERAKQTSHLLAAAVTGTAEFDGRTAVLVVLDFAFMGGSMGAVVGEKVTRAAELALRKHVPLIAISASGGARMQEGILSLLQMAKTAAAIGRLRAAGILFVSVLTDPVYGGVAASFAALGHVIVAERGARAGFAGPQVIEQTIRQQLPPGLQTAEFLLEHGHIDLVVARAELRRTLCELVAFAASAEKPPVPAQARRRALPPADAAVDAWAAVRLARTPGRPNTLWYATRLFDGFVALHGDRWTDDDPAVVGGIGWFEGTPVVVVGHCKGVDTADNRHRNFGMPHPSGYRKALRLFELAEALGVPVITLVDTPGAYPGVRAEEGNQCRAIAELLLRSAQLRVPIVSVVTGEGGSGGALALATGDRLIMQENSVYSVISPEGCATILFGDARRASNAARALRMHAPELHRLGIVDELVPEPPGGAHTDPPLAATAIAAALRTALAELGGMSAEQLVAARQLRLRTWGTAAVDRVTTNNGSHQSHPMEVARA